MENHSFEEVLVMYSGYIENLEQVEFLKKKLSGHNILLGAAGTGKTNLAIAKMQEMVCQENVGNTLFVTYTNALTSTCADDIKELFESASLFDKPYVEIKTFHSLVSAINRQITGNNVRYLTKPKNIIYKALYNCIDKYPDGKEEFAKDADIFLDEIDFLESFDVSSLEEYENIVRSNRRVKSIRKNVRKYYWYVYEEYLKILRRNSDCDFQGAGRYILELGRHYELPKYKNIFIDEGQDFSPATLKALVSLLDEDGTLLYLGDATQEIYGSRLSWKSVGLSVRNKITRLNKNFRNTIEIGNFAIDILEKSNFDMDADEVLYPKDMVRHGKKPVVLNTRNNSITKAMISDYIKKYDKEKICVLCYSNNDVKYFSGYLASEGITAQNTADKNFSREANVTVSTYYSVKGLEFDTVFLTCFDSEFVDNIPVSSAESEEERVNRAYKLFYVACTRAKSKLIICQERELPSIFPTESSNYNSITLRQFEDYFGLEQDVSASTKDIVQEMSKSIFLDKEDLLANFHLALIDAKKELDIQSPWMTPKVVDDLFVDKLTRLLSKGVTVQIAYGIDDDKNTKHKNSITDDIVVYLQSRLKRYPNFKIKKGNSHSKMLICDNKFLISGSYNWLSYDGKTDREEGGTVITDKNEIERVRKLKFDF